MYKSLPFLASKNMTLLQLYSSASSLSWYSFDLESNLTSLLPWGSIAARSLRRCRCLKFNRLVSKEVRPNRKAHNRAKAERSPYLYVTPLDERMRTLCLFFLRPLLFAPSSSMSILSLFDGFDKVLYTAAIIFCKILFVCVPGGAINRVCES